MLIEALCRNCVRYDGRSWVDRLYWVCWVDFDMNNGATAMLCGNSTIPEHCDFYLEQMLAGQEALV